MPGDVVNVTAGQIVPADLLLIDGEYLSVDQAALTGESLPVSKKVGDDAYSGSIAKQGAMTGVVTATGNNTFFGRTAKLVGRGRRRFRIRRRRCCRSAIFSSWSRSRWRWSWSASQVYRRIIVADAWSWERIGSIAQFVLVLLVASIPVALPAVMSVTMAIGAYALSRQKAIVSRLSAIEELAGVDVLCSDKTGTLTHEPADGRCSHPVRHGQARRRDARRGAGDPDKQRGRDRSCGAARAQGRMPRCRRSSRPAFVPFDPVNKRTVATVVDAAGGRRHYAKGAPQVDCRAVPSSIRRRSRAIRTTVSELAAHGYRALGVAKSDDGADLAAGRPHLAEGPAAPRRQGDHRARPSELGLNVKMVTGDDVAIGDQIAKQLGMGDHLLVASDVFKDGTDAGTSPPRRRRRGRARRRLRPGVPAAQIRDRQGLQQRGHIVAMTGDGVNDAPALQAGRLRHRRQRRDRCRAQRRRADPDGARACRPSSTRSSARARSSSASRATSTTGSR